MVSAGSSVIFLIRHRNKDKRETRINEFISGYRLQYKGYGGNFLKHLIPSGINLLENDDEIEKGLNSLELTYGTHPLRDEWNPRVKKVGYSKFFRHAVKKHKLRELNAEKMNILLNELENPKK